MNNNRTTTLEEAACVGASLEMISTPKPLGTYSETIFFFYLMQCIITGPSFLKVKWKILQTVSSVAIVIGAFSPSLICGSIISSIKSTRSA